MNEEQLKKQNTEKDQADRNHQQIRNAVLAKIKSGEIKMRPRLYFIIRLLALIAIAIIMLLLAVLLISFLFYVVKISGIIFLPGFGSRGLLIFLALFPWRILIIGLLLIFLLQLLIEVFPFVRKRPIIYTLGTVTGIVLIIGLVVFATPLHGLINHTSGPQGFPGEMYTQFGRPRHPEFSRGIVTATAPDSFTATIDGVSWRILPPPGFDPQSILTIGDTVFVAGDKVLFSQDIRAFGIKVIPQSQSGNYQ